LGQQHLSSLLIDGASNNRHGLVFNPQVATISASDVSDIFHVGVPSNISNPWQSASGGVSRTLDNAKLAAIAEGIERYSASIKQLPLRERSKIDKSDRIDPEDWTLFSREQRNQTDFPFGNLYNKNLMYTNIYSLNDNTEKWVPHSLVALRDDYQTGIPTSSGLAAGKNLHEALLRALEELIERDALMATWLHCMPGRQVDLPERLENQVNKLNGEVKAFNFTPDYSPVSVIAVAGMIPKRGKPRFSLGVACRENVEDALDKAYVEWCQGVFFAGVYPKYVDVEPFKTANHVKTFDDHAIYYTVNTRDWDRLPLFGSGKRATIKTKAIQDLKGNNVHESIRIITQQLKSHGIRLFYRDLTTIDSLQAGIRVVRVVSPDLIPINAHHEWPFLGGTAKDINMRYGEIKPNGEFPNKFPHPLG